MRRLVLGTALTAATVCITLMGLRAGESTPARADSATYKAFLPLLARDAPQPTVATQPPTAVPTPTPSATPTPSGVSAHSSTWFRSSTGSIWVNGLVTNGLNVPAGYVEVTANLYSAGGTLLATGSGYAELDTIAAHSDSPFNVLVLDAPSGVASVTIQVTDYSTSSWISAPVTGLVLTPTNSWTSITGSLHIVGTVTNQSNATYDYVEPIVALLDSDGRVLVEDFTFTKPSTLAPGQTGTFELLVFYMDEISGPVADARYWVDGNRK